MLSQYQVYLRLAHTLALLDHDNEYSPSLFCHSNRYQRSRRERGNIHVRGLARLKCDTGVDKVGTEVAQGRKAKLMLMTLIKIQMKRILTFNPSEVTFNFKRCLRQMFIGH